MKPAVLALAIVSCASLLAAQTTPAAAPAATREKYASNRVEKLPGPTYDDMVCAGYLQELPISPKLRIISHQENSQSRLAKDDVIYLAGDGYEVGAKYYMLRHSSSLISDEYYPGQKSMAKKYGTLWAVLGVAQVIEVVDGVGVARIIYSCDDALPGDRLIPYQEPPQLTYTRSVEQFRAYNAPAAGAVGVLLDIKGEAFLAGLNDIIYVNLGEDKGVKPGDYLRISRGYKNKSELPPIDSANDQTPADDPTDISQVKISKDELKNRPRRGVGEAMVLSVHGRTATAIITLSLEDMHPGDRVETIAQ